LAAIVPVTLLVTYHRPWDAKLLLLTIPACAILWAEGGRAGRIGLALTGAAIVASGDIPLILLSIFTKGVRISTESFAGKMQGIMLARPITPILLAMSIFFLWVYVRPAASETGRIPA
jgi:hypothetical protein